MKAWKRKSPKNDQWSYEISLRFPQTRVLWLVQRSYGDFQRFHARSALSGSQKAAAVAAGVAGVALTGPLSAVFALSALGGGVGKYQLNKASYLSVSLRGRNSCLE
eukprot:jgi/Phyca11/536564/estExt2_fgenesh1_pg.C_PHYCAscaffold_570013